MRLPFFPRACLSFHTYVDLQKPVLRRLWRLWFHSAGGSLRLACATCTTMTQLWLPWENSYQRVPWCCQLNGGWLWWLTPTLWGHCCATKMAAVHPTDITRPALSKLPCTARCPCPAEPLLWHLRRLGNWPHWRNARRSPQYEHIKTQRLSTAKLVGPFVWSTLPKVRGEKKYHCYHRPIPHCFCITGGNFPTHIGQSTGCRPSLKES